MGLLSGYLTFDENNSAWSSEFTELYTLLSPDEYESAKASTLNAHYTSPTVINAMYEGLENLGFKGGNVLEPSMGVGNFFGVMPEEMRSGKLYGVELDSISGRIAKQLYQNADIQISGFEKTSFPDNFFDVAVGNVPFGQYKLAEKRYDKLNLNIHDHFFAKSLDKVRAGGVVAFVTSKGTLDKANPQFRKYLAQRAELLGAIRLPNNAFKDNAGTEVTSDIIFLQKRDKMLDIEPDWVHLGQTEDGVPVNKYFEQHPEMVLGEMKQGVEFSMYGNADETACVPIEGTSLKEQLKEAIKNIQGTIPEVEQENTEKVAESIPADPNVRNFSYAVVDDKLYFRENSRMFLKDDLPKSTEERIKGMVSCLFHEDKTPSMKLYDDHFYCFGCSKHGDVTDMVGELFGISPKEAAEKIAHDFGISYDRQYGEYEPSKNSVIAKIRREQENAKINHTFRVLCNYLHLLKDWRTEYAPKSSEEQPNPLFVKALTETDYIESLLDYFISGTKDDVADIVKDEDGSIAKIEKTVMKFSKPSAELTM